MDNYKQYRRSQIAELTDWTPGFDMAGVSISEADKTAGSPKAGDKIARNPKNHADRWLVAADYFAVNFESAESDALAAAQAELGQERMAREEAEYGVEFWKADAIGLNTLLRTANERAAELQRRLEEVEAATIERCAKVCEGTPYGAKSAAAIRALNRTAAGQEVKLNGGAPETEVPSSTLGGPAPSAAPIWEQLAAIGDSAPAGTWDKAPDAALPGLELAAGIVEALPIIGQEFDGRLGISGAVNVARRFLTAAIRAEIAKRTPCAKP